MKDIFNKEQVNVINTLDENILLLASAGTGKTNTLSARIKNILDKKLALEDEILCITFTNKACKEMKDRITNIGVSNSNKIIVRTFHSFCFDLVKEEAKKNTDKFTDFIVFDEEDCKEIIKSFKNEDFNVGSLYLLINYTKESIGKFNIKGATLEEEYKELIEILYRNNEEKIKDLCKDTNFNVDYDLFNYYKAFGHDLVIAYNNILHNNHGIDFTDLIIEANNLLKNEVIVEKWARKFKYISVDEVQDTSSLEYGIVSKLFKYSNILLCGDPFQTIYGWRGSNPTEIFNRFIKEYNPREIIFNKNYRSTKNLINLSYSYLKNVFPDETLRLYKDSILPNAKEEGSKVFLQASENPSKEAFNIMDNIYKLGKTDLSKICILTRNNGYNIELSNELREINSRLPENKRINFLLIDQFKFFRRAEIKDITAFLKLCININDSNSFIRILDRFPLGVGDVTIQKVTSKEYKDSYISITDYINEYTYTYGEPYGLLINEWEKSNLLIFDVESTGTNTTEDEIIQIAAIKINSNGEVLEKFERFIKPRKTVGTSEVVHGFSDEFLQENGEDKSKVLKDFLEFSKDTLVIGHNVQFDISILESELSREGLKSNEFLGYYDTLEIYRRFYPNLKNHKLETLSKEFHTKHKPSHNAYDDIVATGELLIKSINDKIIPTGFLRQSLIQSHIKAFNKAYKTINEIRYNSNAKTPKELITKVVKELDLQNFYKEDARLENIRDLYRAVDENIPKELSPLDMQLEFLKLTALSNGDMERLLKRVPRIPVLTVHQAKGLEFDTVFIAGMQENVFPSYQSIKANDLEEEMRLFYVAITRAKKNLFISYCKNRRGRRQKESRLINYLDKDLIQNI